LAEVNENIPFPKRSNANNPMAIAPAFVKAFHWFSFSEVKKEANPITATTGTHNSKITCIDDTALNLLYIGTYSIKKSVNNGKFFPHESRSETIAPARKAYFSFRFSTNKASKNKKTTTAPISAGAATRG